MVLWFFRGLRQGVVTTRYPLAAPDPWMADLPTPPAFDPDRLTQQLADALVAACPSGALRIAGEVLVYDVGACTACQRCLKIAPQAARPSGVFELAATARGQLVKEIPLRGAPE